MNQSTRILQAAGGHTIEIVGTHLISNKLFDITAMLFTAGEYFGGYELNKIIFTDGIIEKEGRPEGAFGKYDYDSGEITIGLQKHFRSACRNIQNEDDVNAKYLSLQAGLWFDLMLTLLHEGFHVVGWSSAKEHCLAAKTDAKRQQEIEDDCTSNANLLLMDLFRDFDMEPPAIAQEPYFGTRFMEFFIQSIKGQEVDWAVRQEIMIDSELTYYDEQDRDGLRTMREWLRLTKEGNPDMDDARWDIKPKSVPKAHINPAVMVAGAETTPKDIVVRPEVQLPVVAAAKEQPITKEASVAKATNEFDLLMSDTDLLEEVKNSMGIVEGFAEPDEVESGETEAPMEVTTQPIMEQAQLPLEIKAVPAETPTTALRCPKCTNTVVKGGKFCPHCGVTLIGEGAGLPPFNPTAKTPEQTVNLFIGGGAQTPAATTGAPTGGPQFTQTLRTGLPNIGMDVGTMKAILAEVYKRMHEHIFEKCGFQVCGVGTGNAVGFNPSMIGNVLQPISIADIPRATELIIAYDKYDPATGKTQMKVPVQNGLIAGKISKNNSMPFYAIYINNNGTECKRMLMAQNPFKTHAGGYSTTAQKAQQGNQISWVWDGADNQQRRTWFHKIENGFQEWL